MIAVSKILQYGSFPLRSRITCLEKCTIKNLCVTNLTIVPTFLLTTFETIIANWCIIKLEMCHKFFTHNNISCHKLIVNDQLIGGFNCQLSKNEILPSPAFGESHICQWSNSQTRLRDRCAVNHWQFLSQFDK